MTQGTARQQQIAEAAFLRACRLDVAVRKPGNVSLDSPGHRMTAQQFIDSAEAAAPALCRPGTPVGERIEDAVRATWAAVDCNTNLGIVLLCAPLVAAFERCTAPVDQSALRASLAEVLGELDVVDAEAAFRAIAQADPGGLGDAPEQDVHAAPSVGLRAAMALAAGRDRIAQQYVDVFAAVFGIGLPALGGRFDATAVLRCYLALLGAFPDSHIVRKHGEALAQTVMRDARGFSMADTPANDALAAWDAQLKAGAINPGTSADLTVASLLLAGLLAA